MLKLVIWDKNMKQVGAYIIETAGEGTGQASQADPEQLERVR